MITRSSFSQVSKQIRIVGAILSRDCRDVPHPRRLILSLGICPEWKIEFPLVFRVEGSGLQNRL